MPLKLKEILNDFSTLIYPRICLCCQGSLVKQEIQICTRCEVKIPRTYYHLVENNPVEQLFWGRTKIEKATSFFIFQKGSWYQRLLHELKYNGNQQIGYDLGCWFAADLKQIAYFDNVDIVVPVPLHKKKERIRGYNQSASIANGLAKGLMKETEMSNLYRKVYSETQTKKGRFERWQNVGEIFDVKDVGTYSEKHVLLVDDVLTTGSTLEACANAILKSKNAKVSVATLAFASI